MSRHTEQRNALRQAFVEANRPLSAPEVLRASRRFVKALGVATVYRNLKRLVAEKWLTVVNLPGEPSRYEVAGKDHHHHFHCKVCDRVFEVPECSSDLSEMTPAGFVLDDHDVVLYGRCRECAG